MKRHRFLLAITLLFSSYVHAQTPAMRARIEGILAAFNATPEELEKHVAEAYTPAFRDASTAAQRREFLTRLQSDFGKIEANVIRREAPNRFSMAIAGSKGTEGTIVVEHELDVPHRITNLTVMLGPPDDAPSLPEVPIDRNMSTEQLSKALDAYLGHLAKDDRFAGTVLVARDGKPLFEKAYGLANRSDHVANTPQTRFSIGSINKHFTRAAIGQLVAAGKLANGDTIGKHLPDYPNEKARGATIQQLLDMEGGLADFFGPDFDAAAKHRFRRNRDYYQFVAPKPLSFDPGTRRQYCNSCYIVLGEIVERLSGMPYEQYVTENVLRRAGMQTAAFLQSDEIAPNVAIGYTRQGGPLRSNVVTRGAGGSAAGSAYATARDLLAMDEALRTGTLVDRAWFFGAGAGSGRVTKPQRYAGGSSGINAGVASDGTWTVIALANLDPPAAEALSEAIYSRLVK